MVFSVYWMGWVDLHLDLRHLGRYLQPNHPKLEPERGEIDRAPRLLVYLWDDLLVRTLTVVRLILLTASQHRPSVDLRPRGGG
jgi:hypothetical protein